MNMYQVGFITWDYLTGLIEADGSFKLSLDKKGNYKPVLSISQKNIELLTKIQFFFKTYKINATLDISNPKNSNRAPQLRIQGSLQVLKLCYLFEKNAKGFLFCSQKYRDFLIIKTALSHLNLNLNPEVKIDFVLNLHKISLSQPDIEGYKGKKTRYSHEKHFGLMKNTSQGAANFLLGPIDKEFQNHQTSIKKLRISSLNSFHKDWCVGIMDGDGCFSISIEFIQTVTKKPKLQLIPSFQLVMEKEAKLTLEMFKFIVGCEGKLIKHRNPNQKVTAIYYRVNRVKELQKLLELFKVYRTRNKIKKEQLNLMAKLFKMKQENNLENYEMICGFIHACYEVTELGKGKGKRKYTLSEALDKVNRWLT